MDVSSPVSRLNSTNTRSMTRQTASGNDKAPAARFASKKKAAPLLSSSQPPRTRVTRRELKKLTEIELEDKDETPTTTASAPPATDKEPVIKSESVSSIGFGEGATTTNVTPTSLHDDFVNLMRAQGLEKMATEAGLMKDGSLVSIKREWEQENKALQASANGKRPAETPCSEDSPFLGSPSPAKKKKYLKINKGLRHFSMKVCQKVEEKHVTSYNEVADELVREFVTMRPNDSAYDEKNIRRRVYDALNVLMAMDIISKERKEIRWKGLPSNSQHDTDMLVAERNERRKSIEQKKQHLQDLLVQQVAMKNLLNRNAQRRKTVDVLGTVRDEGRIFLPFIVVNTSKDTVIQCEMSEDRQDIFFNFSSPFEINDDTEILRRLKLHQGSREELREMLVSDTLLSYLPKECIQSKANANVAVDRAAEGEGTSSSTVSSTK